MLAAINNTCFRPHPSAQFYAIRYLFANRQSGGSLIASSLTVGTLIVIMAMLITVAMIYIAAMVTGLRYAIASAKSRSRI